jgi:hypothetical protein
MTRVAVLGAGVSGSVCAALLRANGVNATLHASTSTNDDAQFFRMDDPRFKMLAKSPLLAGTFTEWQGEFGVLGERGGFVGKEIFQNLGLNKDGAAEDIDFDGFLGDGSAGTLYAPETSMDHLLKTLQSRVGLQVKDAIDDCKRSGEGWALNGCMYDALVLADETPTVTADIIESANQIQEGEEEMQQFQGVLTGLVGELRELPLSQRFVLQATFDKEVTAMLKACPLAGAIVPNSSAIQFMCRQRRECGTEWWGIHSTTEYAQQMAGESEAAITDDLLAHASIYLDQYISKPLSTAGSSFSWGGPGSVYAPLGLHEECVSIEPWNLIACADFLGHQSGVEPAAVSGMVAADRVIGWISNAKE